MDYFWYSCCVSFKGHGLGHNLIFRFDLKMSQLCKQHIFLIYLNLHKCNESIITTRLPVEPWRAGWGQWPLPHWPARWSEWPAWWRAAQSFYGRYPPLCSSDRYDGTAADRAAGQKKRKTWKKWNVAQNNVTQHQVITIEIRRQIFHVQVLAVKCIQVLISNNESIMKTPQIHYSVNKEKWWKRRWGCDWDFQCYRDLTAPKQAAAAAKRWRLIQLQKHPREMKRGNEFHQCSARYYIQNLE